MGVNVQPGEPGFKGFKPGPSTVSREVENR